LLKGTNKTLENAPGSSQSKKVINSGRFSPFTLLINASISTDRRKCLECLLWQVTEVAGLTSDLIELSTRQNFALWLAGREIFRGWARSASGDTAEDIPWIVQGIEDYRATVAMLNVPYYLALKAEALHLVGRTPEALEAIREAEALVERREERC
jgi:hypothetical protein